jgi:hypothetical protein
VGGAYCGVGQLIDELYVLEEIFSLKEPQLSSVVPLCSL